MYSYITDHSVLCSSLAASTKKEEGGGILLSAGGGLISMPMPSAPSPSPSMPTVESAGGSEADLQLPSGNLVDFLTSSVTKEGAECEESAALATLIEGARLDSRYPEWVRDLIEQVKGKCIC